MKIQVPTAENPGPTLMGAAVYVGRNIDGLDPRRIGKVLLGKVRRSCILGERH